MTNARRFILAYNKIDSCLRNIYNYGTGISFSELIRRTVAKNYIVRTNESILTSYARLRNAIVHTTTDEEIIAEPHDSVVENIEKLAELICKPPTALSVFSQKKVITVDADARLIDVIMVIRESNHSNIPVYNGSVLKGIINNKIIVNSIGDAALSGGDIDKFLNNRTAQSILDESYFNIYYKLASHTVTLERIADYFYSNRKLAAMLITKNGARNEMPLTIITAFDIMQINDILDNYQK